jgi:hypothetical protein
MHYNVNSSNYIVRQVKTHKVLAGIFEPFRTYESALAYAQEVAEFEGPTYVDLLENIDSQFWGVKSGKS